MAQNWQPVPLIPGASADDCKPWAAMDLCGWIPERAEIPGGRSDLCAKTLPGLQEFAAFPDCARQRGARNVEGKLFVVFDTTLGEVLTDGSIAIRGTIPGRSRVSMTHNGVNELLIVTGSAGYIYDTSAETLTQITDEGFPGAILADYIGSLFVAIEPLGRYFFNSALNDGASYNALETYQGETKPDRIVSLIAANGELIVFSQRSIEHFAYTGTVNALFENKGISKDRGAASTHAVALLDQAVWFLADDGGFYELRGYELRRVSTHAIEQAWSRCQPSRAFCQTWEDRGHKVVYITFPDGGTWGFDVATRLWHRRESEGMARWRPAWLQKWNGAWYAGEYNSGRVFRVDWDYHLEGADRLIRSCTTGVLHSNQKRLRLHALEVVLDAAGEATTATSVLPLAFDPEQRTVTSPALVVGGGLPDGAVGDVVNFRYATIGGQSPITFTVTAGTLPSGITLNAATGGLTGTYTTANYDNTWTVTATDANGDTATLVEAQYVLDMLGDPPDGTVGDAYSYSLTGTEGTAPYTFAVTTGTLPDGLSLASGGAITGTPTTEQVKTFSVTITDAAGVTQTKQYIVAVAVALGDIYVGLNGAGSSDALALVDGNLNTLTGTYAAGDDGGQPAINPAQTRVYFHGTNKFSYLTIAGNTRTEVSASGVAGSGILIDAAGTYAYVLAFSPRLLERVTLADGTVSTYSPTTECGGMCFNVAKDKIYFGFYTSAGFSSFDVGTTTFTDTAVTARNRVRGVALRPDNGKVYATIQSTVDNAPYLYLWNPADGLGADAASLPAVGSALAVLPDSSEVWVCNYDNVNGRVYVYDTATHTLQQTITVGSRPNHIIFNAAGTRAYVTNFTGESLSVIDVASYTVIATVSLPAPASGSAILE